MFLKNYLKTASWALSLASLVLLSGPIEATSKAQRLQPKACSSTPVDDDTRRISLHSIDDVFLKEKTFEIESKAGFLLKSQDAATTLMRWKKMGAFIRICPNTSSSNYRYVIENSATDEKIEADMTRGPMENSPYNWRIAEIDTVDNTLTIQLVKQYPNGQRFVNSLKFKVGTSSNEQKMLRKMQPGDIIVIGDNKVKTGILFFSNPYTPSDYPFILISIADDDYVTAKYLESATFIQK